MPLIKLQKTFEDLSNQLMHLSNGIAKNITEENVHHFRTTYKKINALSKFVKSFGGKSIQIDQLLKNCYHHLGSLRDFQLLRNRLRNEPVIEQNVLFQSFLIKKEEYLKTAARKSDIDKIVHSWHKKNRHHLAHKGSLIEYELYVEELKEKCQSIASRQDIPDSDLHEVRKLMKQIGFLSRMFGLKGEFRQESFNKLMEKLGAFQDGARQLLLIEELMQNSLPELVNDLKKIRGNWLEEHNAMRTELQRDISKQFPLTSISVVANGYQRASVDISVP